MPQLSENSGLAGETAMERTPSWSGWRFVGLLLACLLLLLGAAEALCRASGVAPMVNHTPHFWAFLRLQVQPDDVVIIGTSRGQRGIHPVRLGELLDADVHQLAWRSAGAEPLLRSFAEDESFRGTVVLDFMASHWAAPAELVAANGTSVGLLAAHSNRSALLAVEMPVRIWAQQRFSLASPDITIDGLGRALSGTPPLPGRNPLRFTPSGFVEFDARWFDVERFERRAATKASRPPWYAGYTAGDVDAGIERLRALIAPIEARGGRVVVVRLPTTGWAWTRDREYLPQVEVYDRFAAEVGGEWHHFTEMPAYDELVAPDGSHLDSPSAARFTAWVASLVGAPR